MDEGGVFSGYRDKSMYRNHARNLGGSTIETEPGGRTALEVAQGSKVEVPHSDSLNLDGEFSIEFWVKIGVKPDGKRWFFDKNNSYAFYYDQNLKLHPGQEGGKHPHYDLEEGVIDTWIHLATTYDGDELIMYVNGEEVGKDNGVDPPETNDDPVGIGNESPDFERGLHGRLDDLRVWSRALTPTEVCLAADGSDCVD